jgi:hypothetical protein
MAATRRSLLFCDLDSVQLPSKSGLVEILLGRFAYFLTKSSSWLVCPL